MIRVHVSDDRLLTAQLRDLLVADGIQVLVRNEFLQGAAGELPINECWPELWVLDPDLADRAQDLIRTYLNELGQTMPVWVCPGCRERIEGRFGLCWQCGTPAPDPIDQ
jgi:hypothetical protein